jgi:hypothetical protein
MEISNNEGGRGRMGGMMVVSEEFAWSGGGLV